MDIKIEKILKELKTNPVIPCINNFDDILDSKYDKIKMVLLYDSTIFDLINIAKKNAKANKLIILNIDMVKGISADEYGFKFLKDFIRIDAITSSSPKTVNYLRKLDFLVMQSLFVLDTKSLKKGIELVKAGKPDLIDVRPGILYPKASNLLKENFNIPIICSGFISNKLELQKIMESGAAGITTSSKELWTMYT
jgi:glycerol uptake operon antiterminator